MSADVQQYPAALLVLAPELASVAFPDEPRASCGACPMVAEGFDPVHRCCTYHPDVPNFLVGRALRRGGIGAQKLLARLDDPAGIEARGVGNSAERRERYLNETAPAFGQPGQERCPFFVEGPLGCGIWEDRNAVCRSWHCKHEKGPRGHRAWISLRDVLSRAERVLADWCVRHGPSPLGILTRKDDWVAWFLWCADTVDHLDASKLGDAPLTGARISLMTHIARRDAPVPNRVEEAIREARTDGGRLRLGAYSLFDLREFPPEALVLLTAAGQGKAALDVEREAAAILGRPVPTGLLEALWHAGLLVDADAGADEPDPPPLDVFQAGS